MENALIVYGKDRLVERLSTTIRSVLGDVNVLWHLKVLLRLKIITVLEYRIEIELLKREGYEVGKSCNGKG